jgi:hypothetical protein
MNNLSNKRRKSTRDQSKLKKGTSKKNGDRIQGKIDYLMMRLSYKDLLNVYSDLKIIEERNGSVENYLEVIIEGIVQDPEMSVAK